MLSKPLYPLGYNTSNIQNVFIHKDEEKSDEKDEDIDIKKHEEKDEDIDIKKHEEKDENIDIKKHEEQSGEQPIKKKRVIKSKQPQSIVFNQFDFYRQHICLNKYKLTELKIIAKHNKILISGSKQALIDKIENLFIKNKFASIIQYSYKTYNVRKCYELRGEARALRSNCVNHCDFYTLEPINEIHPIFFFSYTDEKNFLYGFNLCSLVYLIKNHNNITNKNNKPKNPYNRENLSPVVLQKIYSMYKLLRIVFNDIEEINQLPYCPIKDSNKLHRFRQLHISNESAVRMPFDYMNQGLSVQDQEIYNLYIERNVQNLLTFDNFSTRYKKILEIRERPIDTRINELFMEIDQLGNYTQASWFMNLEKREYIRLYRSLYDIWMHRAQLSFDIKKRICILEDPFTNALGLGHSIFMNDISIDRIRGGCLRVFENLIFTGIDDDFRKLGSLHALTALTISSRPAREALPWLYESIVF